MTSRRASLLLPFRRCHRRRVPFVYILRCADGTLYVGHTGDLSARLLAHNAGAGSAYTAARLPVEMVYAEEHVSLKGARARERQLKGWTAASIKAHESQSL